MSSEKVSSHIHVQLHVIWLSMHHFLNRDTQDLVTIASYIHS